VLVMTATTVEARRVHWNRATSASVSSLASSVISGSLAATHAASSSLAAITPSTSDTPFFPDPTSFKPPTQSPEETRKSQLVKVSQETVSCWDQIANLMAPECTRRPVYSGSSRPRLHSRRFTVCFLPNRKNSTSIF